MNPTQSWRTAAVIRETPDTVTVAFDTGGQPFIYQPGQFINITLHIKGQSLTRSYSLSTSPLHDQAPAITVKRVEGGLMSNYIADHAADIGQWQVTGPHGSFTPPAAAYEAPHIVLLAGGSGITPLFSIARSILHGSATATITLVYSSRSQNEIIFRRAIDEWAAANPGRVNVYHALSRAGDADIPAASLVKGRISKLVTKKLIKQATGNPAAAHYFICGPSALMKLHREALQALEVPEERIYMEWFTPEPEEAAPPAMPAQMQEVLLHFYEQSNLLEVQPGQTILAAALEDRIALPYSCKGGTCGICAARLISGQVSMARNYALRQQELDEGLVLLCQSYPLSSDVTVEIG